ncbi:Arc family DNA-binding protein [Candidatus Thiothrix sp. Deng01]|uniref:Arc family DNA-binding protein n=1 Tax=Candidatus Thiothrix phosphatis TaxID=3112415 RepID=A0ABU6CTC5_9GAMM|nr:Arc family DNA-binding protein [Candidatus Thiothrix sp. Deng01]MEB4590045.1 Arc family DNA-binding protein [Candidatus Thiothrix sp. Deng01]
MAEKEFTQTQIRLPTALYNELKESAEENFRSLNGELLFWIQLGMGKFAPPTSADEIRRIVQEELDRRGMVAPVRGLLG